MPEKTMNIPHENIISQKKKMVHLEMIRIIAIFFVAFNHTGENGFFRFSVVEDPVRRWGYLFLSILTKVAVPLFFMISGAVLLGKKESIGDVLKKRVLKYGILLVIVSAFYWQYKTLRFGEEVTLLDFCIVLYSHVWSLQLWYLYSYLALMLMLPLLRKLAQNMAVEEFFYLGGMFILFSGIIPIAQYYIFCGEVTIYPELEAVLFVNSNVFFFLFGYFLEYVLPEKYRSSRFVCVGIVLSIVSIFICGYMTLYRGRIIGNLTEYDSQVFHNSLIAVPSVTIYLCVKEFFSRVRLPMYMETGIVKVGGTIWGVYLLEGVLRKELIPVFDILNPLIGAMPASLIYVFSMLLVGVGLVLVLKKIPVINKVF